LRAIDELERHRLYHLQSHVRIQHATPSRATDELERHRYFVALVTCDTVATAALLYKECDGLEFEHSSLALDLRFVPDSKTFGEHGPCRDACGGKNAGGTDYEAPDFYSRALQVREDVCVLCMVM
jgi:hypothetical protein